MTGIGARSDVAPKIVAAITRAATWVITTLDRLLRLVVHHVAIIVVLGGNIATGSSSRAGDDGFFSDLPG